MYTMCVSGPLGGQRRGMAPLELDLGVFVNHHVVLGIQPKFSAGAVNAF